MPWLLAEMCPRWSELGQNGTCRGPGSGKPSKRALQWHQTHGIAVYSLADQGEAKKYKKKKIKKRKASGRVLLVLDLS